MQLANVDMIETNDAETIINELEKRGVLSDNLKGQGLVYKEDNSRKKLSLIILGITMILFVITSFFLIRNRLAYVNSPEYLLKDVNGSEYLDISGFDERALKALKGMSIGTLNMDGMGIKDISDIVDINVKEVIISHNPEVSTLWYLKKCDGLKKVTVSEDMLKYVRDLLGDEMEIRVVK